MIEVGHFFNMIVLSTDILVNVDRIIKHEASKLL